MSFNTECPICMDDINVSVNCVTTECGHCFHASCLMRNVAHNGFDCPYCRAEMAEQPPKEEEEDEWEDDEEEVYDDFALRGLRLFTNNINGVQHDPLDISDENAENEEEVEEERVPIEKPSPMLIANKLGEKGITMEDLVKVILMKDHAEYEENEEEFTDIDDNIFGKIRIIISNYHRSQEPVILSQEPVIIPNQEIDVDNSAQPKFSNNVTIRRRQLPLPLLNP